MILRQKQTSFGTRLFQTNSGNRSIMTSDFEHLFALTLTHFTVLKPSLAVCALARYHCLDSVCPAGAPPHSPGWLHAALHHLGAQQVATKRHDELVKTCGQSLPNTTICAFSAYFALNRRGKS